MLFFMIASFDCNAGIKLLSELLDCCRECAQLEADEAYSNMRKFVVSSSSSKTVYILEVSY